MTTPTAAHVSGTTKALAEALAWYGEQARLARLIHREGDAGRHALAKDGGKKAREALRSDATAAHVSGTTKALELAVMFHVTYESLAPDFGYDTRTESREFDPDTQNGQLMVATCARILAAIQPDPEPERLTDEQVQAVCDGFEERARRIIAECRTDPDPQPVASEPVAPRIVREERHFAYCCNGPVDGCDCCEPNHGTAFYDVRTPTPSSAGMVSVEAAAKVLLDACPNPIFDQIKPVLMGEVTERVGYTDEEGNEAYYDRPVSWGAMKEIIRAALRAIAGEAP